MGCPPHCAGIEGTPSWMAPPDGWHPQMGGTPRALHPQSIPNRHQNGPQSRNYSQRPHLAPARAPLPSFPASPQASCHPLPAVPGACCLGLCFLSLCTPKKKLKANPPLRKPHTFLGLFTFSPGCTCPILPSTHWAPKNSQWDSRARFALSHSETNVEEERQGRRGAAGVT